MELKKLAKRIERTTSAMRILKALAIGMYMLGAVTFASNQDLQCLGADITLDEPIAILVMSAILGVMYIATLIMLTAYQSKVRRIVELMRLKEEAKRKKEAKREADFLRIIHCFDGMTGRLGEEEKAA